MLSIVVLELFEMAIHSEAKAKSKASGGATHRGVMHPGHHHHEHLPEECRAGKRRPR